MYVNRPLCSEICLQKMQFHLGPAPWWVCGGGLGGFCCCFLIKGGFLLPRSSLSVVNNVAVGPVQMPRRGKQRAETIEASQIYNLRQQIVSHSFLDMNSAVKQCCSDCVLP